MKKFLAIFAALILMISTACAAPDLTDLTFDQLIALQHYITSEIMSRPEWREITVPAGQWRIGVDIPEGTYCITAGEHSLNLTVWGYEYGDFSTNEGLIHNVVLSNGDSIGKMLLQSGWLFCVNKPVVFTPAITLGF